jgi:glycosyltransferase involved in cell wall biosynthesis
MKIAFLHYHLKTGGVTTVLKSQISALQGNCEILVLTGDRAGTALPCQVVEIPGLGYDRTDVPSPTSKSTADRVLKTLSDVWPGGCDVLHIHNPTLAKNKNFIRCIKRLQVSGVRLFLQIHDFAEDGRPGAYSRESYPEDCHYGVINTRDKRILIKAGLKKSGVHLIPNTIHPLPIAIGRVSDGLVLYPVRAIRRKNIGEAVLLSLYLRSGQYIGVTLPPNSRQDMGSYRDWRTFVKKKRLNVAFDLRQQHGFASLVGAASSMITTSIAEGFGFSFLEPWTVNKVLQGRRLGGICTDFEKNGLYLDFLYDKLEIPLKWFEADVFFQTWQRAVINAADTYGKTVDLESMNRYLASLVEDGVADFGVLSERFQRQVISYLLANPEAKTQLTIRNPGLVFSVPEEDVDAMLENNHRVVAAHYGLETYREQLLSIYNEVVQQPVHQHIDKQILIDAFFDLDRFSLLKWGTYEA